MLLQCRSFVKPFVTEATGEGDVEVVGLYVVPDVAAHALLATNSAHVCLPWLPVVRQQVWALRHHQPQLLLQIIDVCENFLTIPQDFIFCCGVFFHRKLFIERLGFFNFGGNNSRVILYLRLLVAVFVSLVIARTAFQAKLISQSHKNFNVFL